MFILSLSLPLAKGKEELPKPELNRRTIRVYQFVPPLAVPLALLRNACAAHTFGVGLCFQNACVLKAGPRSSDCDLLLRNLQPLTSYQAPSPQIASASETDPCDLACGLQHEVTQRTRNVHQFRPVGCASQLLPESLGVLGVAVASV